MAELVLGRVGAGLLPKPLAFVGGAIGRMIDAGIAPPVQGARVKEFHLTEGREGAGVPVVYGRCRVGGQLIWAAEFKERRDVSGGKGGPRVAEYSYSLSFAVALCEGEVARVGGCWANGELFDLSQATWRLYSGSEEQAPDPLIEAIEGTGAAPAYKGIAYIVFEDLPVDQFGGRMPQLSFEVVRPAAGSGERLETMVRAVNMIPGSGEFALATDIVRRRLGPGRETAENLHGAEMKSDFEASLDQLEAELPNVSRINLIVAWFGSDLRCGDCLIRPGVEMAEKTTMPHSWSVAGIGRDDAYAVSATDGRPNYGGTPSDESVRQAVWLLKQRGYHVTLYPFLLMDIAEGNGLPDPYGGEEQATFPWRGRIKAVGGDVDADVASFFGRYREFILHYASLAGEVGADGVLIGSELIGLTHQRSGDAYPAVTGLRALAADVRSVVGGGVEISYAADWTEYGAHVDGADVAFPLDALWADDVIDYVGVDWYAPLSDWRDGTAHADAAAGDGRSRGYLQSQVAGGEAFDWFYTGDAGRAAQDRLPITDDEHGEPWVFRQKDIRAWWSNAHHARTGGVRSAAPTDWIAGMKPVRFVEAGCPAVDKGANQPNVFYDPKSAESALPHFSNGSRDDVIQRRAIEAMHAAWSGDANNPASSVYDGRMIPDGGISVWAWDARPYPAFPAFGDVWSDAGNWRVGHWLNGRVGLATLQDVVADIGARTGVVVDAGDLAGVVSGYQFSGPLSARVALEPLATVFGIDAVERDGGVVFRMRGGPSAGIDGGRLVDDEQSRLTVLRRDMEEIAARVRLRFVDTEAHHEPGVVASVGSAAANVVDIEAPISMDRAQAQACAETLAVHIGLRGEQASFAMAADGMFLEPGDVVGLNGEDARIVQVTHGATIGFETVRAGQPGMPILVAAEIAAPAASAVSAEPHVVIVDAPALPGAEDDLRPIGFAFTEPWLGPVMFSAGPDSSMMSERGRVERPCVMGELLSELSPHVSGRWQDLSVWVRVNADLSSRTEAAVLNGANVALVETEAGWEMIQYRQAELVDVGTYRLGGLLRGQQGSEGGMLAGAVSGAAIVFLTGAEGRLELADWERGLDLQWRVGRESFAGGVRWIGNHMHEGVAGRAWSPCHLTAAWSGDDVALSWIRRARKGGDSWAAGEPVNEWPEGYRVRVSGGGSIREWDVVETNAIYTAVDQATDFPGGGAVLVEVAQLAANGQPGGRVGLELIIPAP